MSKPDTLVDPSYQEVSGRNTVDGVLFISYKCGIMRYCQITEDGQIKTQMNPRSSGYTAQIVGHGPILSPRGKWKNFQTQQNAARAAISIWRKLQVKS